MQRVGVYVAAGMVDYIPANFFLLNRVNGKSVIVADELVRTALVRPADRSFDRLAVFALHLSLAGSWRGARPEQRYPAEWAKHFIVSRVFASGQWNGSTMNAPEIESFISSYPDYSGVWAKKASTNLHYIYELSNIRELKSGLTERWWGSAIFLALDRILVDRGWAKPWPTTDAVLEALSDEHVFELTAVPLDEGMIAARDLVELYLMRTSPNALRRRLNSQRKSHFPICTSKRKRNCCLCSGSMSQPVDKSEIRRSSASSADYTKTNARFAARRCH